MQRKLLPGTLTEAECECLSMRTSECKVNLGQGYALYTSHESVNKSVSSGGCMSVPRSRRKRERRDSNGRWMDETKGQDGIRGRTQEEEEERKDWREVGMDQW